MPEEGEPDVSPGQVAHGAVPDMTGWSPSKRRIHEEGQRAMERHIARKGDPRPQKTADGAFVSARYWGITRTQLAHCFSEWCNLPGWRDDMNVIEFVNVFVKPKTEGSWMGMCLQLNQDEPKLVNLMISHAWLENAKRFFEDVLQHMHEEEAAYICFLSNYQGTREDIGDQLGDDIHVGPFAEVIAASKRLLAVPCEELTRNERGLYSRMWCDWELFKASKANLPIFFTQRHSIEHLFGDIGHHTSREARCGNIDDERKIRKAIEGMPVWDSSPFWQSLPAACGGAVLCLVVGIKVGASSIDADATAAHPLVIGFSSACVGFLFFFCAFAFVPAYKSFTSDGYDRLDHVILDAATGGPCANRGTYSKQALALLVAYAVGAVVGQCFGSRALAAGQTWSGRHDWSILEEGGFCEFSISNIRKLWPKHEGQSGSNDGISLAIWCLALAFCGSAFAARDVMCILPFLVMLGGLAFYAYVLLTLLQTSFGSLPTRGAIVCALGFLSMSLATTTFVVMLYNLFFIVRAVVMGLVAVALVTGVTVAAIEEGKKFFKNCGYIGIACSAVLALFGLTWAIVNSESLEAIGLENNGTNASTGTKVLNMSTVSEAPSTRKDVQGSVWHGDDYLAIVAFVAFVVMSLWLMAEKIQKKMRATSDMRARLLTKKRT